MKNEYTTSGRQKQKLETRKKILETARELLASGTNYTLDDVAKQANISRATIYRYYSNVDLLSAEAVLDMQASTPEEIIARLKSKDITGKLAEIQDFYNTLVIDNETAFRKYLSIVCNAENPAKVRGRRRVETIRLALQDSGKITVDETEHLLNVISVLMGIEAIVVAKDVCGLGNEEVKNTLNWGLKMVLKGLMADQDIK